MPARPEVLNVTAQERPIEVLRHRRHATKAADPDHDSRIAGEVQIEVNRKTVEHDEEIEPVRPLFPQQGQILRWQKQWRDQEAQNQTIRDTMAASCSAVSGRPISFRPSQKSS